MSKGKDDPDESQVDEDPELLALLKYAIVSGLLGAFLWHLGHSAHATWARVLLDIAGGLCWVVTIWSTVWLLLLGAMALFTRSRRTKPD